MLSSKLGVCTGKHLATHIRNHYSRPASICIWFFVELAIIGSDIQEVIGTAIAFKLLLNWDLWIGVLVTGLDTLTFLLLQLAGIRKLEAFFMALIMLMAA